MLYFYECEGEKDFVSLTLEGQSEVRTSDLRFFNQTAITTAAGPISPLSSTLYGYY